MLTRAYSVRPDAGSRMMSDYAARSDVGLKRAHNEDGYCAAPELGLYLVCDGMGGRNAGEVASALAVDVVRQHVAEASRDRKLPLIGQYDPNFLPQTNRLASAIRLANQTIHRESWRRRDCAGMGTTIVSMLLEGRVLSVAHVGDSRAYLIRGDAMQVLTADHSLVRDQVREGLLTEQEAERSSQKHVLTRALGVESAVEVELSEVPVMGEDILLLCSDGLTAGVTSDEILRVVRDEDGPGAMADRLIAMANKAGGDDNITVVVVALQEDARPGLWRRMGRWLWN